MKEKPGVPKGGAPARRGGADPAFHAGSTGLVVRPVTPDDLDAVWSLMGELARYEKLEDKFTGSPERLGEHLFGSAWPRVDALIAELEGEAVGYAIFYGVFSSFWTRPLLWLEDLYVVESRRGSGLGRALLAAVAREAIERGCPRMDWAVLDWNASSIAFYERLGATRQSGWFNYRLAGAALERLATERED